MAVAAGATPDWSTLTVEGPTESTGLHGRTWYEWRATLSVNGGRDLLRESVDDDLRPLHVASGAADSRTMPQPRIVT